MTAHEFKNLLTAKLQELHYVLFVDIQEYESYIDGKVFLKWEMRLKVFYHQQSLKLNFALIQKASRLWAIDNHLPNGWHRHPLHHTEIHEPIDAMSIEQIVSELNAVLMQLQTDFKELEPPQDSELDRPD